jgi:hypothetical protein
MTIRDLFETLDFSSYDKIYVHWPMESDNDYNKVVFEYSDSIIEMFGPIHIKTMQETYAMDKGDASLFFSIENGEAIVHIYLDREDVVRSEVIE